MSNKNRVRAYADADFDPWLRVLTNNQSRLTVTPNAREPRKQLLDEWTSSTNKLAPLHLAIARTDALIDDLVYGLYGLSADEIAIVKGETGVN